MISTISTIFLLSVLLTPTSSTSTSISLLKTLLKPTLMKATCTARCSGVSSEEMEDCLELCLEVLENPSSTSLCDFPQLCTGGCQAACDSSRGEERRELAVSQQDCLLSWQSRPASPSVWVVAGLDQAGMVSLISPLQLASSLSLSPATTRRFSEITVLAVDRQGLRDLETVLVQEVSTCPLTQETLSQSPPASDFINDNLVHICIVVIITLIFLAIAIIKIVKTVRHQAGRQSVKMEKLEDIYNSDQVFFICQESIAEDVKYLNLV